MINSACKNAVKLVIAGLLFSPFVIQASPASFTESNRRMVVACVDPQINGQTVIRNKDGAPKTHQLTFQLSSNYQQASVIAGSRIAKTDSCTAVLNLATGLYTDQIMYEGEVREVSFRLSSGLTFDVLDFPLPLPSAQTSLWRVSSGSHEVFVGGVVNYSLSDFYPLAFGFEGTDVLRESDFPLPDGFEEAYELSDQLITRAVPSQISSGALTLQGLVLNTQSALSADLGDELFDEFTSYMLDVLEVDVSGLPYRAHWMADLMRILTVLNNGYVSGVESYFQDLAVSDGKTNFGLEGASDQMFAFNINKLDADKVAEISTALAEVKDEGFNDSVDALLDAWRNGDDDTLYDELVKADREGDLNDFTRFYTERFEAWLAVFDDMLNSDTQEFVLIDIRYLVGVDSLLTYLEEQGYTVERY